jgi:putative heme-binding domain-containing protein
MEQALSPKSPPLLQMTAVKAIADSDASWKSEVLISHWPHYTPATRNSVLEACFERESLLLPLLAAIRSGEIKANELSALERQKLLSHETPTIRAEAIAALAGAINSDRAKVIEKYSEVQMLKGDVANGRALFVKHCASCHVLEGQGHAVGPDLAALTNRSIPGLLESLLDPNRTIDERYQSYTATTDEGLVHTGILVRENATSITLLGQQGIERTLLRRELDELVNSRISFMPDGFERDLSPQDVADVFAYLSAYGNPEPNDAASAIAKLLDLSAIGTPQEYERIPAIWKEAIAAGKRNDAAELKRILELSLPNPGEPLRHWQAVVIGGGVINGLSLENVWPRTRVGELIQGDTTLAGRWSRVIDLAAVMADDESVPTGTRYDALRILGADRYERRGNQLAKYLSPATHPELQMGAVSGLADMEAADAVNVLIQSVGGLTTENQELAIGGLLRTEQRAAELLKAIERGAVSRSAVKPAHLDALRKFTSPAIRGQTEQLLNSRP